MKRILAVLVAVLVLATGITVFAAADTYATSLDEEYRNVAFSNGYLGFCVDYGLEEAYVGDQFKVLETSAVKNNADGADVSAYLKAIFVEGFHNFFTKNADGVYEITTEKWDIPQRACWHFTDGYENYWDEISPTVEVAKAAVENGLVIPDQGYTKMVDQTTEVTFNFALMETTKDGQQCFFAYAISQRTIDPNQGEEDDDQGNNPPVPPVEEVTPTDPEDPPVEVETPTDTPVEPPVEVETPTDTPVEPPVDTPTDLPNEGENQEGEGENNQNPPNLPGEGEGNGEENTQTPNGQENGATQQPQKEVTPTDNPKTGEAGAMGGAMVTLGVAAAALVVLKKRK